MAKRIGNPVGAGLGVNGFDVIQDTTDTTVDANSGHWFMIQVITDAVFTSSTVERGDALSTTLTYPAGITLYGKFTQVQLTSGSVHCYRAN